MRAARSAAASKSTSPTSPSSVRLIPTSITVAPGLTQSPCTMRGAADRGDEHVGAAADAGQVARARVAHRDGRVAREQHLRDRLADEVGAPDDDRLGALELDAVAVEQLHAAGRACTAAGPGRPFASSPAETGVSPSTSFAGSISHVSPLPSMCPRRRQLEQDARDARVAVELGEQRLDLGLRRVGREPVVEARASRPRASPSACRRRRRPRRGPPPPARSPAPAARCPPPPTRPPRPPPRGGPPRRSPCRR